MSGSSWDYPGARWWRFDFHAHTPASKDARDPLKHYPSDDPKEWLLLFMRAGIDCVAVTDHNSGEWIDKLKAAYAAMAAKPTGDFRELTLFPGVEISVSGGIHLLAIFGPSATTQDIDDLLSRVDYRGTKGDSDEVTGKSLLEVVQIIAERGALAIPAHADDPKGLLQLQNQPPAAPLAAKHDANTLRRVIDAGKVLAMESIDPAKNKPAIYTDENLNWTEVLGSDCHSATGPKCPGSRFTWVKMASPPSLEGLRLALLDGAQFSIKRFDDPIGPPSLPAHHICSIEISEARFMGRKNPETIKLNPWFNAIIGGRGTGKSSIVHALRLAYCREKGLPTDSEAYRTFERFKRAPKDRQDPIGALDYESEKRTTICVTSHRDGHIERIWWRQDGSGPVLEEADGAVWKPALSQTIPPERFPIRIFSQGQIAALSGEKQEALLELIDDAAGVEPAKQELNEARQRFLTTRARIREIESRLQAWERLRGSLEDVQRKLAGFEGHHHASILREFQLRTRQNREVERQLDTLSTHAQQLHHAAAQIVPESLPPGLFDQEAELDAQAMLLVGRVHESIDRAALAVEAAAVALDEAHESISQVRLDSPWYVAHTQSLSSYKELQNALKSQGVADPGQYGTLVQERQRIERDLAALDAEAQRRDELEREADSQLDFVMQRRRKVTELRRQFLEATLSRNPYVQIQIVPFGKNLRTVEASFRVEINAPREFEKDILLDSDSGQSAGLVAKIFESIPDTFDQRQTIIEQRLAELRKRLEAAAAGHGDFGGHFNNFLKRESDRSPEFLDRLILWAPEDALDVAYSLSGNGKEFRPLEQASAGQRAAAMLAFLLAHGDEPLILDQPEDDLDNKLIFELVVRQIRAMKSRRQLIVVTHNPNIVVNGDAEMVHVMDFRHGQCKVVEHGSMQQEKVREEICKVMEGGRDAFERRYRRIGMEGRRV